MSGASVYGDATPQGDAKKFRTTTPSSSFSDNATGVGVATKTEKDANVDNGDFVVVKNDVSAESTEMDAENASSTENVDYDVTGVEKAPEESSAPVSAPVTGASTGSFAPSSGSAFSSVSKAAKKTHQQVQQHLHPSALSSYYSTSASAPGGGAYYLGWNRLQEQLRNQQVVSSTFFVWRGSVAPFIQYGI